MERILVRRSIYGPNIDPILSLPIQASVRAIAKLLKLLQECDKL